MIYVLLADGFEEVEAFCPLDCLRRAKLEVQTVGITGKQVTSSHGVPVTADILPEEVRMDDTEMVILPGGMPGANHLFESTFVKDAVRYCVEHNRYIAAICAAPSIVLGQMGILDNRNATCFPGMEDGMKGARPQYKPCVVDQKIITGRAAGASFDFALALITALVGKDTAEKVRASVHYGET